MIPAGDFVLTASLIPGRLTYLPSNREGLVALVEQASDCILGCGTMFNQVYKGHCGETLRSFILGGGRGEVTCTHI